VSERVGVDDRAPIDLPSQARVILNGRREVPGPLLSAPSLSSFRLAAEKLLLGLLPPVLLLVLVLARYLVGRHLGFDFRPVWEASRHLLSGASPYPPPHASALGSEQQFVYPPLAALLAAPLAAFPFGVAAALFAVIELVATFLTLRLLDVRDWRCYGITLLWYPVLQNFLIGSITSLLALGLAVVWRYRGHRSASAFVTAALIGTKVFLWPMVIWLAATRRTLTAAWAVVLALVAITLSWALVGFGGLTSYPRLLSELSRLEEWKSYSAVAFGLVLGLPIAVARTLAMLAGVAVLIAAVLVGRRYPGDEQADRRTFALALAAAFIFSPIVWTHYLALLVVPIAITRRTLSPLWFVPLAMWVTPVQSDGQAWRVVVGMGVWIVVLAATFGPTRSLPALRRNLRQVVPLNASSR
jgi:alpha-1,2-mannosyltransferase